MLKSSKDWLLALIGGALLALMIQLNSLLGKYSSPIYASWIAHGIGGIVAFLLWFSLRKSNSKMTHKAPFWAYLGGLPGSFTVILASITVNSFLALSGTLAMLIVGQVIFGIVSDQFGLFGVPKRKINLSDIIVMCLVLSGSSVLLFCGR